jgi:hypothetical protein
MKVRIEEKLPTTVLEIALYTPATQSSVHIPVPQD